MKEFNDPDILVVDNFISDEDCQFAIDFYNSYLNQGLFNKYDNNRLSIVNPRLTEVDYLISKYLPKVNKLLNKTFYVRDLFISIYNTGAGFAAHTDYHELQFRESLSILFYFNDDFTGGEIKFTKKDLLYKPKKGSILIFPCNKNEYEHEVKTVTSGVRYAMPVEINENEAIKVY